MENCPGVCRLQTKAGGDEGPNLRVWRAFVREISALSITSYRLLDGPEVGSVEGNLAPVS